MRHQVSDFLLQEILLSPDRHFLGSGRQGGAFNRGFAPITNQKVISSFPALGVLLRLRLRQTRRFQGFYSYHSQSIGLGSPVHVVSYGIWHVIVNL